MNRDEYARLRDVEDRHWWYRALRRLVWDAHSVIARSGVRDDAISHKGGRLKPGVLKPVSNPHALEPWQAGNLRHQPSCHSREGGNLAIPETPQAGSLRRLPLLDIGCGTGGTLANSPRAGIGIDRSLEALRLCHERGQRFVVQADAAHLPFAEASFSGALLLDVLYHRAVPDPTAVLREAHRVIAPGGHLIVNVPAYNWLHSSHDDAIHTERRFTRPQLRALLTDAGFSVVRATYWNTLLFPVAAAVRVIRRQSGRAASDLADYRPGVSSAAAAAVLRLEAWILHVLDLPFGLSILAVARKV